jgi:hydroxyacylglutathione hydrolase
MEILEDLFFVQRGYLNANHLVYRSKDPILIDTAYVSDFADTEKLVGDLGVDLSKVGLIINTHTHCDHIGGNAIIQESSGCRIALHKIGKHFIDHKDNWSTWWKYFDQEADFFQCTLALEDGDEIPIGPHRFRVIYTPGHASDGIVLHNAKNKVLISSDTLWETDMAVMNVRVEGSRAPFCMLESLDKISSLDVEIVYPGHGRPFKDFKDAISKTKKRLESFLANNRALGNDLLKKIIVYTLMMRKSVAEETFFDSLMKTHWFTETVDLYFAGEYADRYEKIMKDFSSRGIVKARNGRLVTTVKP